MSLTAPRAPRRTTRPLFLASRLKISTLALCALLSPLGLGNNAFAEGKGETVTTVSVPPPPEIIPFDASLEPQVTIKKQDGNNVEEFRMNGKLYLIKVTPTRGAPYYLIDQQGNGNFSRMEGLDSGLSVPQWVIGTF
ncbi:MAG: DUF2782 domain-containing protein [Pseudomonadota bacterium]